MPASKTETSIRLPEAQDQKRRIRNTTQDRKWASRMQEKAKRSPERAANATAWPVEQLLETTMDDAGNPVPDPVSFSDGQRARRRGIQRDEQDMVEAMNDAMTAE
ncbi:hypothetical protein M432DRAFT_636833 [Thermoascus aurantiacus ATCC 26904]